MGNALLVVDAGFRFSARVFAYDNRTHLYSDIFTTCDESHYYEPLLTYLKNVR